jgi:hypothetical protein
MRTSCSPSGRTGQYTQAMSHQRQCPQTMIMKPKRSYLEAFLLVWIFSGIIGKLVPVFFIPVIKSLRPHFIVAAVLAAIILIKILYRPHTFGKLDSDYFLSLLAWGGFIGVSAVSFINLDPMQVLLYRREGGTDSLFVKLGFMFILMILFVYGRDAGRTSESIIKRMVKAYDIGFIVYFLLGWPLYIAAVTRKISRETYFLFTVQFNITDESALLRFCPGDYPNGAGEMLAVYIIFIIYMRRYIKWVPLKLAIGFASILITTTRAGILPALFIALLFCASLCFKKLFTIVVVRKSTVVVFVTIVIFIIVSIFITLHVESVSKRVSGLYNGIVNASESQSVQKRYEYWSDAYRTFNDTSYLGDGFARYLETHNVMLQLLAEIGIFGTLFFLIFICIRIWTVVKAYLKKAYQKQGIEADFIRMLIFAIPANGFFALTNHNLFHFTFWFLCIGTFIIGGRAEGFYSRCDEFAGQGQELVNVAAD